MTQLISRRTGCRCDDSGYAVTMKTTWKPIDKPGAVTSKERRELPDSAYAFPGKRKEPLVDAKHVRNAIARFDQVQGVTDRDRDQAFANIQAAARHYDIDMVETNWRQLGKLPHTPNPAQR